MVICTLQQHITTKSVTRLRLMVIWYIFISKLCFSHQYSTFEFEECSVRAPYFHMLLIFVELYFFCIYGISIYRAIPCYCFWQQHQKCTFTYPGWSHWGWESIMVPLEKETRSTYIHNIDIQLHQLNDKLTRHNR